MTISWRDRDALISIAGVRENLIRRDRDRDSESGGWRDEATTCGGMRDFKSLFWALENVMEDHGNAAQKAQRSQGR